MRIRSILIAAGAFAFVGSAPLTASGEGVVPNLAGTYKCEPAPEQCRVLTWSSRATPAWWGKRRSRATYRSAPFPHGIRSASSRHRWRDRMVQWHNLAQDVTPPRERRRTGSRMDTSPELLFRKRV